MYSRRLPRPFARHCCGRRVTTVRFRFNEGMRDEAGGWDLNPDWSCSEVSLNPLLGFYGSLWKVLFSVIKQLRRHKVFVGGAIRD